MSSTLLKWAEETSPDRGKIIVVSLASILLYYITTTTLAWYRLRHFPGPPLAAISNLWNLYSVVGGDCHHIIQRTQDQYGKVVRVGPNTLAVFDPEIVRRIGSARSSYDRAGWYGSVRFHPEGDSVFSEMNTTRHDKRKAKLIKGFSGKGVLDHEADIDSQIAAFVNYIKGRVQSGKADKVDFSKIARWFQLDLITLIGMGEVWGDLDDETDHFDFLKSMDLATAFIHSIAMMPLLRNIVFSRLFLHLAAPRATDKSGMGSSIGMMRSIVKARINGQSESKEGRPHGGMLDEWIKDGLSADECEWDLAILMPAGTETSITSIRGTLLYILSSPSTYQKLKQEISDGIKEGRISKPITYDEAKELPYLQAVISEGMRMVPPVINGFAKRVPPGGDTIHEKFVPEGTEIQVNYISMMKSTETFGADAAIFRPERFLECDAATKAHRLKTVELCFGYGRWLCLGKSIAQIELNKIYVELLREFDFQIFDPEQCWKRKGYTTSVIDDFNLRIWENPLV
ncbi:hypothetical protein N0V93_001479 [Gnomoniopsis smithogilvyi]|uniref:Cytochrome P450 n=1 Tax=Gnomoniopsis smithogilvyi TaxID=1191159 RepID=A0A9W8Z409_9PEZI|nr:hypothetical protein N0V93_001479 [Gnomoniopsis smithogilvyi]